MSVSVPDGLVQPLATAAAAIRQSQTIVMACHVNPDGDALGSLLGLALALIPLGKTLVCLSEDGVPDILKFLPGAELIQQTTDQAEFDLALVVDSGDFPRVGKTVQPLIGRAKQIVDIDHHAASGAFGDIRVLNARAASTAEIVYALLLTLQAPITPEIATCLFTGIITDTGSFRFQNVSPNTLQVAAALLEAGAPPAFISENVFENRTFAATRLLGHALSSLTQSPDGRVVWAHITAADFAQIGATDQDTEGIVSYVRGVRGAEVGVLFREMAGGGIRVSLRARESVNVAEIAGKFGGGGHRMASGCTVELPLAEAEKAVIDAVLAAQKM
ncbi:MAG: DHH family phosphoesterase [Janthinobacterium lividum]